MMDEQALDGLLAEFKEYLRGKRHEGLRGYKKTAPAAPAPEGGGEEMSEECRMGMCDHPEHASDADLDEVLG